MTMPEWKIQQTGVLTLQKAKAFFPLAVGILLAAVWIGLFPFSVNALTAINGTLDITGWNFDRQGIVKLNGQWVFFPDEWLGPDEVMARKTSGQSLSYIRVPSSWEGFEANKKILDENGFATYALELVFLKETGPVAIHIPEVGTAYNLFIDGKNVITMGKPARNAELSKPRVEPTIVHFIPQNGHVQMVFQVSNFHHRRGGIWETIHLGPPDLIHEMVLNKAVLDLFLFGVILVMGLYNFGIYYFRKKESAPLFFAVFCILVACRILVVDERLIFNLMPFIPTPVMYKIEYITFYLGCSFIFACLYYSYPRDFNRTVFRISQGLILLFSAVVLFSGMTVFTKTLTAFQILCLVLILYCIRSLLVALKQKRTGVRTFLVGFGLFSLTVLNDILYARDIIYTLHMFHMGMLVFVLCQSYTMARRFGLAYQMIDDQRQDLDMKNKDLARELQRRKDAESLVEFNENKYRQLTELLPGAVFETDCSGRVLFANRAASSLFGWYPSTKARDCYLKDGIRPEDQDRLESVFSMTCRSQQAYELEVMGGSPEKDNLFPAILFLSRVRNREEQVTGVRGIAIDLSTQKELEKRIRHSEKIEAIGTLAGGIAHDFNNILSIILGYAELTQMEIDPESSVGENLEAIVSVSLRARDLVSQILSYSRKDRYKKSLVNMEVILTSAVKLVRATIPSNIEIREIYPGNSHTVFADATQIHQIVLNLTTNAVYAMKVTGGQVTISVENVTLNTGLHLPAGELSAGDYVCMTFKDTGCGIQKADIARIFDPFFTTKGPGSGTGMGLSVVQGIVQAHGGAITVESPPGNGTCFRVYFPVFQGKVDPMDHEAAREPVQKGFEHILFVDDEFRIVSYSKKMLIGLGYQVTALTSSRAAFNLIKKNPHAFDLVITDMTMPLMTGSVLAVEIKTIRRDLPVILCTGYSDQITPTSAGEMGISAFLMKPISRADLARTIRSVLDNMQ